MSGPLIATKLHVPPAPAHLVPRPHLIQILDSALERPQRLILVSAPAGFGKTTLVAEWLRHARLPSAWLSLDRDDNDPARFWRYFIAALQTADAELGRGVQGILETQPPPPPKALAASLVNDLDAARRPLILILDDYHLIETEAIHAGLNTLLERLPPPLRIVITTRADPPLALARLRSRDQITETRTADLRFTRTEAAAFLNRVHQLDLPEEDIAFLEKRTEGWIVGLQLAALSLHRQSDRHAFVAAFAGDDRYIVDYLLQEVLGQQTPEVHSFLLRTSILDRLCGPLCEAVTGEPGAEATLRQLEDSNLFILPLDNRRYWYRYHTLFADLLRRRLEREIPSAERPGLFRRAAEWLEREGFIFEAVSQALAAPDYGLAADLLERHALTYFFRSESGLLGNWLRSLPEEVLRGRALLCAVHGNLLGLNSLHRPANLNGSEAWLDLADRALGDSSTSPGNLPQNAEYRRLTRNFIALSRAYVGLWRRDEPRTVITLARQALAGLPPAEEAPGDPNYLRFRSGLNYNLAVNYIAVGDPAAAERSFAEARRIAEAGGDLLNAFAAASGRCYLLRRQGRLKEAAAVCREAMESIGPACGDSSASRTPYAGIAHVDLGLILLEWNELPAAEASLRKGLDLLKMSSDCCKQAEGNVALAEIRSARGEADLESFLLQAGQSPPDIISLTHVHRVRAWLRQGALEQAVRWAREQKLEDSPECEYLALARVILACHPPDGPRQRPGPLPDPASLRNFLECLLPSVEASGWTDRWIELRMLQALAWQADRDAEKAAACLRQALSAAKEGGYIRRFTAEGRLMLPLLKNLAGRNGGLNPYIDKLLAAGIAGDARPASPAPEPLIEPLSRRELEVLQLMALGDSNAEISKKLVITLNTTKKHVTHIFEKMEVPNRSKAVGRAREIGLVA
jgi:LuxR family maltose regulon positive regulatory protein